MISVAPVPPTHDARWRAVEARDARPTADLSMRSPAPASIAARRVRAGVPARTASVLSDAGCRRARGIPRLPPVPSRAERSVPEQKVERARVWIRRIPTCVPRSRGWPASRRLALAPAADLQAAAGRDAGRIRAGRRAARLKHELKPARSPTPSTRPASGRPAGSTTRPRACGMTPRAYRAGGRGERIRFTTLTTRLGAMLVAATDRGSAASRLATTRRRSSSGSGTSFPPPTCAGTARAWKPRRLRCARLPPASPSTAAAARRPRDGVSAPRLARAAGDSRGRDADLCRGRPADRAAHTARAVARACATNPVALAVPCHRVVPAAGGTGGYRWGSERKKKLLADEARNAGR